MLLKILDRVLVKGRVCVVVWIVSVVMGYMIVIGF